MNEKLWYWLLNGKQNLILRSIVSRKENHIWFKNFLSFQSLMFTKWTNHCKSQRFHINLKREKKQIHIKKINKILENQNIDINNTHYEETECRVRKAEKAHETEQNCGRNVWKVYNFCMLFVYMHCFILVYLYDFIYFMHPFKHNMDESVQMYRERVSERWMCVYAPLYVWAIMNVCVRWISASFILYYT